MEMRKILIADGTRELPEALSETLQTKFHVRICRDGLQALEQLRSFEPDLLVLDLMLPELDGISLLQAAAAEGISANVLALTRFVSPYVLEAAARLGVSYIMMKPCDVEAVTARIHDLAAQIRTPAVTQPDIRNIISNVLISLRVPTKLRGYCCAREAVLCLMREPGMSITKELYPQVAAMCDGTAAQVERAIRGAIQAAWNSRDDAVWRRYFLPDTDGSIARPSNAEFLSRIADKLCLEQERTGESLAG